MSPQQRQPPGTPSRSPLATVTSSAVKSSHSQTTPRSRCTQRPLGMTSKQENILEDCLAAQREVNKGLFDNIGESNKILGDNAGESNKNISRMLDIAFSPGLTPKQESILEDLIAAQREANKILGDNIGQANKILGDNIGQGNDDLRRMLDIHFNVNSEAIAESTAVSLAAIRAAVTEMLSPDRSAKRSNENHVHTSSVAASHACASQDDQSGLPCASTTPVTVTAPPVQQYSSFGSTSSGIAAPAGSVAPSGGDSSH
ncbi:hypothetical protein FRACYDRAFT_256144 [Fragilariopsis cylindrus CCMP1102]|uniref:Uncharacterized protein n=1 Tax=Fragilariopsis cylindrus CCMP1102 TaxID=635003 RepID=A0A1E7EJS1_9STRA|nr:hypothetical protein FRACYDRAFT_256144 [Fragilariopsis cylindrus CCMP1102]|eukprot:OEU06140.1 hypothetical protein FRACYDRAFT_256144 [Fragilariopsis cylindrus CCMP1102]